MDGVVREVNVRVVGKGLELLSANGGRFEINQLLFADDTALVADSEKFRLVSEFGRVCKSKSKFMRCSRYGNGGRMYVILNCKPFKEVDCFKYLASHVKWQLMEDEKRMWYTMNQGYRVWRALKSVLSNRGLGIKA